MADEKTDVINAKKTEANMFTFAALASLFFMWGFITVLNDLLIPAFKASFDLTYTQASLVQFCFFGAYFIVSPLADLVVKKMGYQMGIVAGLLTTAGGALFFPSGICESICSIFGSFSSIGRRNYHLTGRCQPLCGCSGVGGDGCGKINCSTDV